MLFFFCVHISLPREIKNGLQSIRQLSSSSITSKLNDTINKNIPVCLYTINHPRGPRKHPFIAISHFKCQFPRKLAIEMCLSVFYWRHLKVRRMWRLLERNVGLPLSAHPLTCGDTPDLSTYTHTLIYICSAVFFCFCLLFHFERHWPPSCLFGSDCWLVRILVSIFLAMFDFFSSYKGLVIYINLESGATEIFFTQRWLHYSF